MNYVTAEELALYINSFFLFITFACNIFLWFMLNVGVGGKLLGAVCLLINISTVVYNLKTLGILQ